MNVGPTFLAAVTYDKELLYINLVYLYIYRAIQKDGLK